MGIVSFTNWEGRHQYYQAKRKYRLEEGSPVSFPEVEPSEVSEGGFIELSQSSKDTNEVHYSHAPFPLNSSLSLELSMPLGAIMRLHGHIDSDTIYSHTLSHVQS